MFNYSNDRIMKEVTVCMSIDRGQLIRLFDFLTKVESSESGEIQGIRIDSVVYNDLNKAFDALLCEAGSQQEQIGFPGNYRL